MPLVRSRRTLRGYIFQRRSRGAILRNGSPCLIACSAMWKHSGKCSAEGQPTYRDHTAKPCPSPSWCAEQLARSLPRKWRLESSIVPLAWKITSHTLKGSHEWILGLKSHVLEVVCSLSAYQQSNYKEIVKVLEHLKNNASAIELNWPTEKGMRVRA